jgi:hypothetical protein
MKFINTIPHAFHDAELFLYRNNDACESELIKNADAD